MILVTTPTGDIGSRVLTRLMTDTELPIRAILREPSNLPLALRKRIDVVEGSHGDAETIGAALEGIDRVFWLPPGDPTAESAKAAYVDFSRAFAEALPTTSVTHVVGVSALGRGWNHYAGLVSESIAMDDMIAKTGVAYRALACSSLMDNLKRQTQSLRDGKFFAPTPAYLPLPHVAKSDVAAVAAGLLSRVDWNGAEDIPLHGPENLTFAEIAKTLTDVLGRPVVFSEVSMEGFAESLRKNGASPGMTQDYVAMLTAKNDRMDTLLRDTPRHNTPTTFRTWAEAELRPTVLD
ncbi:NAD(P)H-binding protein [uncultured Roseobacter sp.]|uniref:NAD(P)H-binding protein n=1 Tax=uncultured Roseobacter sp. TaxID=114847 RepID=UPI0026372776|nr:NAD(P)H-binding protein [uncultured Roseobacter sp.]